jgi:hypothetical protein
VKSSQQRGGLAGIVAVLLVVGLVAVAVLVIRRPQATTTGAGGDQTCQGRPRFVMDETGATLYALAAVSRQDVWAVGTRGTDAVILHWDGGGWRDATLPALGATSSLAAVAATGPRDGWAVGWADLAPLILHWDGTSWARVAAAPVGAYSAVFSALAAVGPADMWALGSATTTRNGTPHTIAERWAGRAWRAAPAPPGHTIIAAANGAGPGAVVIAATASDNVQQLARWNGRAWQPLAAPGGVNLQAVAVGADGALWAGGSYWPQGENWAQPILERWDGAAWSQAAVGQYEARGARLTSLAIGGDGSVWAGGMLRNPNTRLENAFLAHVDGRGYAEPTGGGLYPARYDDPHTGDSFGVTAVAAMPGADGAWLIGTLGAAPDPSLPPIDSNLPRPSGAFVLADC